MNSKGLWNSAPGNKQLHISMHCEFLPCANSGKKGIDDALRTYATWLVRATRQKMGTSEPENIDNKSRINLTKDGELR
jgi:hypothetical protein